MLIACPECGGRYSLCEDQGDNIETPNEKMVRFYLSKDATEMMAFLAGCHPDAEAILPPPYEDRNHDSGMEP